MAGRLNTKSKVAAGLPGSDALTTDYVLPGRHLIMLRAALICGLGLWIYWPAIFGGWIWDDSMYLSQNPLLDDPARLWKAWFVPGSFIEYYPLAQTVQWMQWQLWGNDTFGYHLTNIVLHLVSALLVWRLLDKFGLRLAWLGGLLFAVHPMMVESVAWISELKNTLSLPFLLLAFCSWIDFEQSGRTTDYRRALGFFLLSMLCKISGAPFPVIILLYAWWKRGRIRESDVKASAPFFIISIVLGSLTLWCGSTYLQSQGKSPAVIDLGGVSSHCLLAGQTLIFYLARCFWPLGPLPIYPQWKVDPSSLIQFLPWLAIASAAFWIWRKRQGVGRHLLLGLGFFILTLAPFLGFISASYMNFTWVMDHFLYLPIIGVIGLVVAGIEIAGTRISITFRPLGTGLLTVIVGLLAFESHWYAAAFTGEETFWTYTVDRNPGAWFAHNALGKILLQEKQLEDARAHLETAIRLKPDLGEPYNNLGMTLAGLGQIPDALAAFHESLQRDPYSPETHNNLGILLAQGGHPDEAMAEFQRVLARYPSNVAARVNLGNTMLLLHRLPEAITQFQLALQVDRNHLEAHDNLGVAYSQSGQVPEAVDQFKKALEINPNDANAQEGLAKLSQGGK